MCGIVGVISAYQNGFSAEEQDIFRDMLFLDTLRGWDSTGVFMVSDVGNVSIRKKAVHGPDFLRTPEYQELKKQAWSQGKVMVGHNRAATRGTVNDANAHPFWVDDKIVLVQNGTYQGSHKHHKDVEVDTEAVAHVIAENTNIEEALQKINAAYALVWYNTEDKKLYLIRNDQRPLWLGRLTSGAYVFASEAETLFYSASRAKVKFKGSPELINSGDLHTFTFESGKQPEHEVVKIDNKFRWEHSPKGVIDDSYEGWANYYGRGGGNRHHFMPPVSLSTVRDAVNRSLQQHERTEKTFWEYIKEDKFEEFCVSGADAATLQTEYQGRQGSVCAIELIDYLAVFPEDPDCKDWFVYGRPIATEENTPSILVYLRVQNTSEKDVLDFVTHGLYTVQISQGPIRHYLGSKSSNSNPRVDTNNYVVATFSVKPVPIEMITNEVENHVH